MNHSHNDGDNDHSNGDAASTVVTGNENNKQCGNTPTNGVNCHHEVDNNGGNNGGPNGDETGNGGNTIEGNDCCKDNTMEGVTPKSFELFDSPGERMRRKSRLSQLQVIQLHACKTLFCFNFLLLFFCFCSLIRYHTHCTTHALKQQDPHFLGHPI
jgi:hypothetical protein